MSKKRKREVLIGIENYLRFGDHAVVTSFRFAEADNRRSVSTLSISMSWCAIEQAQFDLRKEEERNHLLRYHPQPVKIDNDRRDLQMALLYLDIPYEIA